MRTTSANHEFNRVCAPAGLDPSSWRSKLIKVFKKVAI
jgi:hypothetical protein